MARLGLTADLDRRTALTPASFPALQALSLDRGLPSRAAIDRLLSDGLVDQLDEPRLRACDVGPKAVRELAAIEAPRLWSLDLSDNPIGAAALALFDGPLAGSLRYLRLEDCGLTRADVSALERRAPAHVQLDVAEGSPAY